MTPIFLVIDLFCGAGGTSTGFAQAFLNNTSVAKVIGCVNHDPLAIKSHSQNYPDAKHFIEDIRTLNLTKLTTLVHYWKQRYPDALLILWASLECTNFSKAKGGVPKNADSRTLAQSLLMPFNPLTGNYEPGDSYLQVLQPDYIMIENVVEFMAWGPLDDNGRPVSKNNGTDWLRWRKNICQLGYTDKWEEMNAANYGAYTSRNRLFGLFAKPGLPLIFPAATHTKAPALNSLFGALASWNPVANALDLAIKGKSIFTRKKPLSEKTLLRIYTGLAKYAPTKASAFLSLYYSTGGTHASMNRPAPVIPTKDRMALIQCEFLPATQQNSLLFNPAWGGQYSTIQYPCRVIIARQDKAPLSLLQWTNGHNHLKVKPTDSPATKKLKALMAQYSICDITLRMLTVEELLKIQGFPPTYQLAGPLKSQKKFIGNSVVPIIVQKWAESLAEILINRNHIKAA